MSSLFQWFESLISWFGLFIPRRIIVRRTDRLIKFKWDGDVSEEMPGMRFYWPITTEVEEITVVRQPLDIKSFSLVTKDNIPVIVDATIVYKIVDAIQFISENFDSYTAVSEAVSASLRNILSQKTFKEIQESEDINDELTKIAQEDTEDFGVEIYYCRLQNFTYCIPISLSHFSASNKIKDGIVSYD
jgi:regulator of protease activity HflC (stomatin/prohibitin superfamily)